MDRVNGLKSSVELGEWRGHDVEFDVEKNCYHSGSAGIRDAKTLAEIKRLIDAQVRKKYRPIRALYLGSSWSSDVKLAPHVIVAPAFTASRYGGRSEAQVWVTEPPKGGRQKLELERFCLDTPANRAKIEEAIHCRKQSEAWRKKADKIVAEIPRCKSMPEEIDPGEEE